LSNIDARGVRASISATAYIDVPHAAEQSTRELLGADICIEVSRKISVLNFSRTVIRELVRYDHDDARK
jgi:hypothetical protein